MGRTIAWLENRLWFPDPREPVIGNFHPDLVALGGDLSVERLLLAYRSGIFPWSVNPITWWSPDPRAIIELGQLHVPRSLIRTLRCTDWTVTFNRDFRAVIEGCARSPRPGDWITREFVEAYTELHQRGHAHSLEVWRGNELIGGIYGVAIGGLFAGESMFHRATDASKHALVHLHQRLCERGFRLFDIQMITDTTRRFGAVQIPRLQYLERLSNAIRQVCAFV